MPDLSQYIALQDTTILMSTTVLIKWSGKEFHIPLQETDTVNTLKRKVHRV